jgi:hypothetical protein
MSFPQSPFLSNIVIQSNLGDRIGGNTACWSPSAPLRNHHRDILIPPIVSHIPTSLYFVGRNPGFCIEDVLASRLAYASRLQARSHHEQPTGRISLFGQPTGILHRARPAIQTSVKPTKSTSKENERIFNGSNEKTSSSKPSGLDLLSTASLALERKELQQQPAPVSPTPSDLRHAESSSSISPSLDESPDNEVKQTKNQVSVVDSRDNSPDIVYIENIQPHDILCGRGGRSNNHTGNKKYRLVVANMKYRYQQCPAKTLKTDLSRAIVEYCHAYGARFIKYDETKNKYYVLSKAEARKKTSQALREMKALKWLA